MLNCKTNGVPPAFIYFMFTDNKTDGINVTKEVLKDATQFTRSEFLFISFSNRREEQFLFIN